MGTGDGLLSAAEAAVVATEENTRLLQEANPGMDPGELAAKARILEGTITHRASQTRRKPPGERTRWDCPLPVAEVLEPNPKPMGPRQIRRPRWDGEQIREWRRALFEGRPPAPRARDEAGRYAPVAADS